MAFNYSPKPVIDSSLVLYLDAANPRSYVSGSATWTDVSRGGNTGALTNGPTFNSANGGSIVLDGVDDYVNIPSNTVLNQPKTLSVWYYTTGNQISVILSRGIENYDIYQFNTQMYTYWGSVFQSSVLATITFNQWNNYTYVLSGNTEFVYKNGVLLGSANLGGTPSYTNTFNLHVGRRSGVTGGGPYYTNGRVSNVQIYNRPLSAAEVRQNYNALKGRYGLR